MHVNVYHPTTFGGRSGQDESTRVGGETTTAFQCRLRVDGFRSVWNKISEMRSWRPTHAHTSTQGPRTGISGRELGTGTCRSRRVVVAGPFFFFSCGTGLMMEALELKKKSIGDPWRHDLWIYTRNHVFSKAFPSLSGYSVLK